MTYFLVANIVKNVASKERFLCGVSCKSANISLCYKWVTRTAQQVVPRFSRCIVLVPKNPWTTPWKLKFTNWSTRGTCKEPSSRRALLKRLDMQWTLHQIKKKEQQGFNTLPNATLPSISTYISGHFMCMERVHSLKIKKLLNPENKLGILVTKLYTVRKEHTWSQNSSKLNILC